MARRLSSLAFCVLLAALLAGTAHAVVMPQEGTGTLANRSFVAARTAVVADAEAMVTARPLVANAVERRWEEFRVAAGESWVADVDKRTGRVTYAEGTGVPWVPGRGNRMTAAA